MENVQSCRDKTVYINAKLVGNAISLLLFLYSNKGSESFNSQNFFKCVLHPFWRIARIEFSSLLHFYYVHVCKINTTSNLIVMIKYRRKGFLIFELVTLHIALLKRMYSSTAAAAVHPSFVELSRCIDRN